MKKIFRLLSKMWQVKVTTAKHVIFVIFAKYSSPVSHEGRNLVSENPLTSIFHRLNYYPIINKSPPINNHDLPKIQIYKQSSS